MSPKRWRRVLKPALRGDITPSQFGARFMRLWRETRARGERNPKPVEDLYHYVCNYVSDPPASKAAVNEGQLQAAMRKAHSQLAPKGAVGIVRSWLSALPLCMVLIAAAGAQEVSTPPQPAPPPNPIVMLEQCVRAHTEQLETSREAADLVAVAAIQHCSRELTAATTAGGQPRSLAEARQQLKDAMREIAIAQVVDIRAARYAAPPPKIEEPKTAPKRAVRRVAPARPAAKTAPQP